MDDDRDVKYVYNEKNLQSFEDINEPIDAFYPNFTNEEQFDTLSRITIDLAEDIYCNTLDFKGAGDDFFNFTKNPRYNGEVVATINAELGFPKILVWDWSGDKRVNISKTRIIVIRGTHSFVEWEGNLDFGERSGEELGLNISGIFHIDFAKTGIKIWNRVQNYIKDSPYPVIITGHSRGGSLSEMLHVIAKKNLPEHPIYCLAYAPAPSMFLNESEKYLTKDIYGFVYRSDPIVGFALRNLIDIPLICKNGTCDTIGQVIIKGNEHFKQFQAIIDEKFPLISDKFKNIEKFPLSMMSFILSKFSPIIDNKLQTYAASVIVSKINSFTTLLKDCALNPDKYHVSKQVGTLYHLKWTKQNKSPNFNLLEGCSGDSPFRSKLNENKVNEIIKLPSIVELFGKFSDHDPRFYRHAIHDSICQQKSKQGRRILGLPVFENYDINNNFLIYNSKSNPSWIPNIKDSDEYLTCSRNNESNETDFEWISLDAEKECNGIAFNCNIENKTIQITCTFKNKGNMNLCSYYPDGNKEECYDITREDRQLEDRCMSGEKINQNQIPQFIDRMLKYPPGLCPKDVLGNFTFNTIYVSGPSLNDSKKAGYIYMEDIKDIFTNIIPPSNFHYTAIWVGENDTSADSLGLSLSYNSFISAFLIKKCMGTKLITLGEFKQYLKPVKTKKLQLDLNITLSQFLDEFEDKGTWREYYQKFMSKFYNQLNMF